MKSDYEKRILEEYHATLRLYESAAEHMLHVAQDPAGSADEFQRASDEVHGLVERLISLRAAVSVLPGQAPSEA